MAPDPVYANGRTIVHAGDGSEHVCAPPDVCKTPTPGGPQPVPYVNVAKSSDLTRGTKQTKIAGKAVAIVGSQLRTSTGNEPGSAGGLVSGKTKGKAGWHSGSPNVRFEGKSVLRFMDSCLFNGNTYNSSFKLEGGTGWAYGDDTVCFLCAKSQDSHRLLETDEVSRKTKGVHAELVELYKPQRSLVMRSLRLVAEFQAARKERDRLVGGMRKAKNAASGEQASVLRQTIKQHQKQGSPAMLEIASKIVAIQTQLRDTHVLRAAPVKELPSGVYSKGFMIGLVRCKCGQEFVASSSESTPGFEKAAQKSGAKLCGPISPTTLKGPNGSLSSSALSKITMMAERRFSLADLNIWVCAAAKALQGCYNDGHMPAFLSEVWFGPSGTTVTVKDVDVDGQLETTTRESGQTTPSCRKCRVLLPALLCDVNEGECG